MKTYFHVKSYLTPALALLLAVLSVSASHAQIAFEQLSSFATGGAPREMAAADLDGDGDIDIVSVNFDDHTVSVLLNNGNATFASPVPYAVGLRPLSVAIGNIDGDSDLDLVVANQNTANISILRNNGNGTFAAQVQYAVGGFPSSVTLVDVDNDNNLDAVVGSGSVIYILLNGGSGIFGAPVSNMITAGAISIAAGDLDNDGDQDLAASTLDTTVAILKNNGDGTFGAATYFSIDGPEVSTRVELADLDGDGDLDIISGNRSNSGQVPHTVSILLNNGNATLGVPTTYITIEDSYAGAADLAIADMNSDANPDVILVYSNTSSAPSIVSVLIGNGDGTFKLPLNVGLSRLSSPDFPLSFSSVAVADFDGDGKRDIAALGGLCAIALNKPEKALFYSPVNYGTGVSPTSIASADFDNDSDQDIVVVNQGLGSGTFSIFMNNGDGTFTSAIDYAAGVSPYAVDVADFDNDSDLDIVVSQSVVSYFPLKVFWNNGSGAFPSGTVIDGVTLFTDVFFVSHGDIDADGDQDIVTANGGQPNWIVRNNGNQTFTASTIGSAWPNYDSRLRDVDRDGDSDYIGNAGNSLAIRKNNGSGVFSPPTFTDLGYEQRSYALADFDGDGDVDISTALHSIGIGIRILNDGIGNFSSPDTFAHGGGYETKVIPSDFDGDGADDLVYASFVAGNVTFLKNDGSGNFGLPIAHTAGFGPRALTAADFDGDGDLDLAVANQSSNNISILLNMRGGTGVDENDQSLPTTFTLEQNYPNPFNPATTISFGLPSKSFVSLKVFDVLGREAAVLLTDELPPGSHTQRWNAAGLASGVYFYRLQAGAFIETRKLVLLK